MNQEAKKTGRELEQRVADAYRRMGARKVEHDKEIAGHQIDVYVELEAVDRSVHRIAVEAKDYSRPVGIRIVSDFSDIVDRLRRERLIDEGVIVSAGGFSRPGRNAAQTHCIRLLELADVDAMITGARRRTEPPEETSPEPDKPPSSKPSPEAPATILIPAGPFWRGSSLEDPDAHDNEKPPNEVNLPAYRIGRYSVTNAQYACFLAENPDYPVPHSEEERAHLYNWDPQARIYPEGKADHPVVLVSWEDATAYCRWISRVTREHYRLPTEEEWEKAARGDVPEIRRYPWGDEWRSGVCNTEELGLGGTTSVRKFERIDRSPRGVADMAGNVWEWTASWYGKYSGSPHESVNYGQHYRVVRGGSWQSRKEDVRISCRGRYEPDAQRPYLGFRIALDVGSSEFGAARGSRHVDQAGAGIQINILREETPKVIMDRARLRQNLMSYFSRDELQALCFDLGVDYENFPETKRCIAMGLVEYLERCGRISELMEVCRRRRPNAPW